MKKKLLLMPLLLLVSMMVAAQVRQIANVLGRQTTSLNGAWNYIVDVQEEGYYDYRMNPTRWGFFRNAKPQRPEDLIEYDFDKAPTMQVPGDWNTQDERLFFYEGTVWFKRSFDYHQTAGHRTLLYFGAVNYDSRVWVNGHEAGHHVGGFTPFNYDVTEQLKDGENVVIVKVDNKRRAENVPTQIFDWWNYGGITRDVLLVDVEDVYVENYSLQLDKAVKGKKRTLNFAATLNIKEAGHEVVLSIPELRVRQSFVTDSAGLVSSQFTVHSSQLRLWSPEGPKLYQVEIRMGGSVLKDEIGFRTIETRGKQILLNGEPIFLKGVSIHEEKPNGGGRANCTADAHTLLSWAKDLGCNFVRLAHYPHNEYAIREAERMGILVWSEIPVYWTIDWTNPDTYANARQQLTDMISRDLNRANVIIWSIANETPHSAERDSFLGRLAQYARSLDSTRLISMAMEVTGASNYKNRLQDNMNEYVDVVSFNQYIGWYRDVNDAPKMEWEIPYEKPVIISEFGGGAKYGYHGEKNQRWTEEFQENLYRQNLAMLDKIDGLAGTSPWVLKDFRSPRRVLNGIQDYYNRKGLYSDKGEKKKAFYVLKDWYALKNQGKMVSVLGDSYSTFENYLTPSSNYIWYFAKRDEKNTDVERVSQTWWHLLISQRGWKLGLNNSFSGSTICNTGYNKEDYSDRSFTKRMDNLGNPDIIFIFGATNDSWAKSPIGHFKYKDITQEDLWSFRPAMAYMLDWMTKHYKGKKIYFILNDGLSVEVTSSSKTICAHYGVRCIELKGIDKISGHPSIKGMQQIADQINAFIDNE